MTIFISWSIEKGREEEDFQVRIWLHFYMLEPSGKRDETAVRHVFQAWFISVRFVSKQFACYQTH